MDTRANANRAGTTPGITAFAAHTRGGWQAAGRDDVGELLPGAPATFAVWDAPTLDVAIEATPQCLRTVVDGQSVFVRDGDAK